MTHRPLRVLYSFPHPLGDAGIGTTAINQVRGLVSDGHRVTVYTTSTSQSLPSDVRVVRTMTIAGHRVPHRAVGVERAYRYHDYFVARVIGRRAAAFDLVHVWPRGCTATLAAARRSHLPSFRESPSPHTASAFAEARRAAEAVGLTVPANHSHYDDPARLTVEEAEYAAADFVLAPSDYVVQTYLARGMSARQLLRHRYGFDPASFPAPGPRDPERPFTALFLGRGEPNKGLHHALRAWVNAGLAGRGRFLIGGSIQQLYERVIADLLLEARVERMGFVHDKDRLLRESDILLLPTATEGSALVTYEAMASGVVPLVSDAAGAPIVNGVDGFVHRVDDVIALTDQIVRLEGDRGLLAQMRANALERRDELSWASAGVELARAYRTGLRQLRASAV